MSRDSHWPERDERRWHYQDLGYRRGGWHGPYRRGGWSRRSSRRTPEWVYGTIVAILALLGAFSCGVVFVMLAAKFLGR